MTGIISTKVKNRTAGSLALAFVFMLLTLFSCSKVDPVQEPEDPIESPYYVQLQPSGVTMIQGEASAIVSIESAQGEAIVTNKKVSLNYLQGRYLTDRIEVKKGELKVTKFIVLNQAEKALFATPLASAPKGSLVAKPLPIVITAKEPGVTTANNDALAIGPTDQAPSFGYVEADFGAAATVPIFVSLTVNVGEVAYKYLSGKLKIEATDAGGNKWSREIDITDESTMVNLPDGYVSYSLSVQKWNALATKQLSRQELLPNMAIELKASKQPKQLAKVFTYMENSAGLSDDTRTEFFYTGGKLSDIRYYQRQVQVSGLQLTYVHKFFYENGKMSKANRHGPDNTLNGETSYTYTGNVLTNMLNKSYDQQTGAAVEYGTELGKNTISVDYVFNNGQSMFYRMETWEGNIVKDQAATSTGGRENSLYEYDENINPYHQLNYPDLYFARYSKNNRTMEQKTYGGAIPTQIPYKFEYVYDEDGYPKELYTSFKGYSSGQHLYRIKKLFQYQ